MKGLTGLIPENLSDEVGSPKQVKVSLRKDSSVGALPKSAQSDNAMNKPSKLEQLMRSAKAREGGSETLITENKEETKSSSSSASKMNSFRPVGLSMRSFNSSR